MYNCILFNLNLFSKEDHLPIWISYIDMSPPAEPTPSQYWREGNKQREDNFKGLQYLSLFSADLYLFTHTSVEYIKGKASGLPEPIVDPTLITLRVCHRQSSCGTKLWTSIITQLRGKVLLRNEISSIATTMKFTAPSQFSVRVSESTISLLISLGISENRSNHLEVQDQWPHQPHLSPIPSSA